MPRRKKSSGSESYGVVNDLAVAFLVSLPDIVDVIFRKDPTPFEAPQTLNPKAPSPEPPLWDVWDAGVRRPVLLGGASSCQCMVSDACDRGLTSRSGAEGLGFRVYSPP